jgi:ATP-dependent DNA helicase RecG
VKRLREVYALAEKLAPLVREISWTDLLHRIALIEKAGTGIRRMIENVRKHKCPEPKFAVNGFFTATFRPNLEIARQITPQVGEQVTEQVTEQVAIMLQAACEPRSLKELQSAVGLKHRPHFINAYMEPLLATKWLAMTIPDKPRSSKQRYRTTDLGREVLAQWHKI